MEFSEKLLALRKSRNLTQEELAEQLNVSRQSVSKWESGQALPEPDKIIALSGIFQVTTDYLLKPSEIDELSIKTQMLERQQKELENTIQKGETKRAVILQCAAIYILSFAIILLIQRISWEVDFLWNIFPGVTLHAIIFLIATVMAIFTCKRYTKG